MIRSSSRVRDHIYRDLVHRKGSERAGTLGGALSLGLIALAIKIAVWVLAVKVARDVYILQQPRLFKRILTGEVF